jgi:hypothetical protein
MSHDPYRDGRQDDLPPTKPMILDRPAAVGAGWIAVALVVAGLVVGYVYLAPDAPSPAMRAESPPTSSQPAN